MGNLRAIEVLLAIGLIVMVAAFVSAMRAAFGRTTLPGSELGDNKPQLVPLEQPSSDLRRPPHSPPTRRKAA